MANLSGTDGSKLAPEGSTTQTDADSRMTQPAKDRKAAPPPGSVKPGAIDDVSISLRQAYESTLHEDIPDALMDLLRKLD